MVMLEGKMINLENISDYTKAVLAIVIGEQVMRMLPKGDGFLHSRKTLDLCWKCIEEWEKVARDVIGDLCYCIDPEDNITFEYYSKKAKDDTSSNIYIAFGDCSIYRCTGDSRKRSVIAAIFGARRG